MTNTELSAIRARCEAATPGPWEDGCDDKFHVVVQGTDEKIATMRVRFDREQNCYNAIFIAHARTDIPALLAHIDEQRVTLAKAEADKAELVEALEEMVSVAEIIAGFANIPANANGPLIKSRAALARVKEVSCQKN